MFKKNVSLNFSSQNSWHLSYKISSDLDKAEICEGICADEMYACLS